MTAQRTRTVATVVVGLGVFTATLAAGPARLKDVVTLQGTTSAPLIGYSLVVGLNKTGDRQQTIFTLQTLTNLLQNFNVKVSPDSMQVADVAAVIVTTELPAFARAGARLDVTVSAIGDAKSLQGGTLLATPLHAANGDVVGIAQGPLSIGGFGGGTGSSSVQINHLTVGRVPGGAIVQNAIAMTLPTGNLTLALNQPDFTTASRIAQTINQDLGAPAAKSVDAGTVTVAVPDKYKGAVPDFMAHLDDLSVETETVARVVINERTGTVVIGGDVRIGAAAVAHGNLSVRITTHYDVSQPTPLSSGGQTVVVPQQNVDVHETNNKLVTLEEGTTLDAVTRALNALGASPRDIIAIMQALKAAGALRAEIVIL